MADMQKLVLAPDVQVREVYTAVRFILDNLPAEEGTAVHAARRQRNARRSTSSGATPLPPPSDLGLPPSYDDVEVRLA